jgi:hypothetical protein
MRGLRRRQTAFLIAAGASAWLMATSALANADAPPAEPPAPATAAPGQLFISPMGEPFRAPAGEAYPVVGWFAQLDRNGDSKIDAEEFRADAEAFFHTLDTNHDGVIDGFEISDYEHKVVPEILGVYSEHAAPGDGRRRSSGKGAKNKKGGLESDALTGGAVDYELTPIPEPVASVDADLSGKVTLDEFLAVAARRFAQLDSKSHGYLTLADLPKTPVQKASEAAAAAQKKDAKP